ncbi:hypothetical protein ES703_24511 [subsurface metagenome]
MKHQRQIHHRELIDDQHISCQRIILAAPEDSHLRIIFQCSVNRFRFSLCRFRQPLGCSTSGSGQNDLLSPSVEDIHNGFDYGRFSGSGSSGDDQEFLSETLFDGEFLCCGKFQPEFLLDFGDCLVQIKIGSEKRKRGQLMD